MERANRVVTEGRERMRVAEKPMLREADAYLSEAEVVAVRLYSGPAYQPLNGFLREVAKLQVGSGFRKGVSRHPRMTFCATVGHLCRAIRKLSAVVDPAAAEGTCLYRGVRGKLDNSFWMRGEHGMICATDTAFMSTSRNAHTPVDYMGQGMNVLWKMKAGVETDDGFHHGADIGMLSQARGHWPDRSRATLAY